MHDVVRDMALHITRKRFLVKAGKQLKEIPKEEEWSVDLEKASLVVNDISTIPQNMKAPEFQKLTTLLLLYNSLKEIPDSFFKHTPSLKILNLSFNLIQNLPNSISNLEKLTALLLCWCDQLDNLPSLSKLQALKKLDLRGTSIKEIPQGLEVLVNLRYLNFGFTKYLKEISNGSLSKLFALQYLAIHPASTGAEEIRELKKLEVFEGCFNNVCNFNMYANATQRKMLHKYWILVSHMLNHWRYQYFDPFMDYNKSVAFVRIDINSGDGIMVPNDIQQLEVLKCKGIRSLNDICGLKDATDHLKECRIEGCDELESIFSSACQLETLEFLHLIRLKNLKGIVGEASAGTFSSLKKIHAWDCGKIKKLFSAKWVLHNLEEINIWNCDEMEVIIASEEEGMGTNNNAIKYTLPRLRELKLGYLKELKSICSKNGVMVCDSLQLLQISKCPKLKRIPLYLPLHKEKPSPPPSLRAIRMVPKEWESMEWDHPDSKNVLLPFLNIWDERNMEWKQAI